MPAIVVCAACQTKLKVPENSTAKALKCPKCKGIVPIAPAKASPPPKPAPPPPEPKPDEEFEVNEAVDDQQEEFEVNEAADDQEEELEVNEAADEEEDESEEDEEDDEDAALVELGFTKGKDPFKLGQIPEAARKAIQKAFVKNEKALWAGRPSKELIESKAWLGFVVCAVTTTVALLVCLGTGAAAAFAADNTVKIVVPIIGFVFGTIFFAAGVAAVIFRKHLGGNVKACYVVSNKRAYIYDGRAVRAFAPLQLTRVKCEESAKFAGAGDLIFAYDLMGNPGVQVDREQADAAARHAGANNSSTPVGFLNINQVQLVRQVVHDILVEPALKKAKQKKKQQRRRYFGEP